MKQGCWHAGPFFEGGDKDFLNLELSDTNLADHTSHSFKTDRITFQLVPPVGPAADRVAGAHAASRPAGVAAEEEARR